MADFAFARKYSLLRAATVVAFDCRGCMAHDHQLMWIGKVDAVAAGQVRVRIIKRAENPVDAREADLGVEYLTGSDNALQWVANGLFFWYR